MNDKKLELLFAMNLGNWTSEKKKVSDTEIVEAYSGDVNGRIRTVLNSEGKPVVVEGTLNNLTVRRTYVYNADGSVTVTQEVK
jgi:hypothetical protein